MALDSAKFAGLMTAEFVGFMEKKAYSIARKKYCIPERDSERISMTELFDAISGSETGAIIASSLVVKNPDASSSQKNKYFSTESIKYFVDNTDVLYIDTRMTAGIKFLFTAIFIILFSAIAYKAAEFYFRNPIRNQRIDQLIEYLKIKKKILKKKCESSLLEPCAIKCEELFLAKDDNKREYEVDLEVANIYQEGKKVDETKSVEDSLEVLIELLKKIDKIKRLHLRRQGYKWYWLLIISCLTGLILYIWLIPAINYLFLSSKVNTELSNEINKFIPGDKIEDIVDNVDLIIPTWELNNREPYLFSKNTMRNEPDKYSKYNNLQTMTFLSAVNPLYILPYQDGDKVFISGNNFAKGPSM